MDLIQAAWMIRDLGQPVSAIDVEEDSIIAGGWDGLLKKWNGDGDLLWSIECSDRIEAILRLEDKVVVTSGLHVFCVKDGEILWSNALEGSADLLELYNGEIIATSSVYDIEHGDFMESAIWKFSIEGELIGVERMDERPWFVDSKFGLTLGLGRPKCGFLSDSVHHELPTTSPVTCGLAGKNAIIFGHADGTITSSQGDLIYKQTQSVESISLMENGFVAALENGELVAITNKSKEIWKAKGQQISTQTVGFDQLHWCGRADGSSGQIEVRNPDGQILVSTNLARPRVSDSSENRVGFGFEDGQILVWEQGLFNRRSKQDISEQDGKKSALAAKLRSLRN